MIEKLSFVGLKVIECFKDAGLDQVYIDDKIEEFSTLNNYESLHKALRILDDKNMHRLAKKLGVHIEDLESTLLVLNQI
ncbi:MULTISPECIES: hypothetical protein [Acinetobacter]|uniref:Uncharacterized protein n=1 Tax=Acinetobacter junii TaxID=40215 RepID=A0AAX1MNF0_ACIJU|nr:MULTISPECIES: hypothetical protein [Acinetobacter]QUY38272.1 hypothetical protein H2677_15740 [Acinetobacter junii]